MLGIRLRSLKKFARRIVEAYLRGDLKKSDRTHRRSYILKKVQSILGYGNYNNLWIYLLALTLSRIDLGKFLNEPRARGLRVKFLGTGFGECELTDVEDEILDFQDSFEKVGEYLAPEFSKPPYPVLEPKILKLIRIRDRLIRGFCERIGPLATCPECNLLFPFPHGTRRRCPNCGTPYFRAPSGELVEEDVAPTEREKLA